MSIQKLYNKIKSLSKTEKEDIAITINSDDVFLVSFPKSGNTWMRFLLINYLYNSESQNIVYSDLEQFIPSIHKSSLASINAIKGKKIVKSHFVDSSYPKIIYLVRDGRDALVSYYYYQKDLRGFEGSFEEFYYSKLSSEAGSWDEHLRAALKYEEQNEKHILFIKFEDLKTDPMANLTKVVSFLGETLDEEKLKFAIERSSFNELKKMQASSGVIIDSKKVNFFRKGVSQQWTDYFSEEINNDFMEKSRDLMERFNYNDD